MEANEAKCLFAVESGSRAWGFESANSDYDVRFVYWMPKDWYLSIENKRDVIEEIGDDDLDFAGWDLRKALKLAHKSNPSLHDWLATPDCYDTDDRFFTEFKELSREYFDPHSGYQHFRSMATTNFRDFVDADKLPFKKYFYVFRALLCSRYIADHRKPAPCLFQVLLDAYYPDGNVREEIEKLLEAKRKGIETADTSRNPTLHREVGRLLSDTSNEPPKRPLMPTEKLDEFFRKVIES
ncbi:MAG: nucleotidyltransferase domain-containing protein [Armatimonadetes bacterium]|nr:nucleotidyltransferase domain-containing protein [Armatimonadota bacterium]